MPFLNLFCKPQLLVLAVPLSVRGLAALDRLVLIAFPLAIVGGLVLAFMKMSKIAPIRWIASAYINVIRGTPLFLQICIVFVGSAASRAFRLRGSSPVSSCSR